MYSSFLIFWWKRHFDFTPPKAEGTEMNTFCLPVHPYLFQLTKGRWFEIGDPPGLLGLIHLWYIYLI